MLLYPVHQRQPAAKLHDATASKGASTRLQAPAARPHAAQAPDDDRVLRAFQRALKEAQKWKTECASAKTTASDLLAENATLRHGGHEDPQPGLEQTEDALRALQSKYATVKSHYRARESALAAARATSEDARQQARELRTQLDRKGKELQAHADRQTKEARLAATWQERAQAHERDLAQARKQLGEVQGLQKDLQAAREQLRSAQGQAKELAAAREQLKHATDKLQRLKGLRAELDTAKGRLADVQRIETEASAARKEAQELSLSRNQLQTAQQRSRDCLQKSQKDLTRSVDMLSKADQVLQICACAHEKTPLAQALQESRSSIASFLTSIRPATQA
jgi:DNA repair exonuclease SbcCD ATPase subunit